MDTDYGYIASAYVHYKEKENIRQYNQVNFGSLWGKSQVQWLYEKILS